MQIMQQCSVQKLPVFTCFLMSQCTVNLRAISGATPPKTKVTEGFIIDEECLATAAGTPLETTTGSTQLSNILDFDDPSYKQRGHDFQTMLFSRGSISNSRRPLCGLPFWETSQWLWRLIFLFIYLVGLEHGRNEEIVFRQDAGGMNRVTDEAFCEHHFPLRGLVKWCFMLG